MCLATWLIDILAPPPSLILSQSQTVLWPDHGWPWTKLLQWWLRNQSFAVSRLQWEKHWNRHYKWQFQGHSMDWHFPNQWSYGFSYELRKRPFWDWGLSPSTWHLVSLHSTSASHSCCPALPYTSHGCHSGPKAWIKSKRAIPPNPRVTCDLQGDFKMEREGFVLNE